MLLNFDDWDIYDGFSPGSGFSEKEWIIDKSNNTIGLFKYPKSKDTFEHFSEKMASELGNYIGIECAKVDIGYYNNRIGSLSYLLVDQVKEELHEGIRLIYKLRKRYNPDKLIDEETQEYYSIDLILESLNQYNLKNKFLDIIIFDYLIGNTDRHHSNWAIITKHKGYGDIDVRMSPLYDNGSSLCCYTNESVIIDKQNDSIWFKGIADTKSKSIIRIDKFNKKKPNHLEMVYHLKNNYYSETVKRVNIISDRLTDSYIRELIETYSYGMMSEERKRLLIKFLNSKVKDLLSIYNK